LQEKLQRTGAGAPAHTTLYGLDHDRRILLHEHRTGAHASHPSLVKRMEDASHLILDAPPSVAHASASTAAPLVSSVRKAHSLQVQHLMAVDVCKVTVPCRHRFIPPMEASPVPRQHHKTAL